MLVSADQIHNGQHWLPQGSIIELDETAQILALHEPGSLDTASVVHYPGILCPGFVNAHCHLELSHMKGALAEGTGLIPFLESVVRQRNQYDDAEKQAAQAAALAQMQENGIVALGDIANTSDTLALRATSTMHFFTFVESIGFNPERAEAQYESASGLLQLFAQQKTEQKKHLKQSIVPHAPYSVSDALFDRIAQAKKTLSIHNQESDEEDKLFRNKSGAFPSFLANMGIPTKHFNASGRSSVQTYTRHFDRQQNILFVHNTYSSAEDIRFVQEHFDHAYWCLCPNANLYIEQKVPDVLALQQAGARICLGTDSLASNHQLCIYQEIKTLMRHFPELTLEELICWGCYNGARALQMDDLLGSIAVGKQPGIVWIRPDDQLQKLY